MPDDHVVEGGIRLDIPPRSDGTRGPGTIGDGPFYNPAMRFNRDLSVLVTDARMDATRHDKPFRVYDGLAASGARGIRLAKECTPRPGQTIEVVCNDRDPEAVARIRRHAESNGVTERIEARNEDFTYGFHGERFDHVDIDPFGSPAPFFDAAIRHVRSGGTIAATATDVAALCGVYRNVCRRRYDATPWHGTPMHEVGLRILAGAIVRHAARFDKAARPVLMHATDHYMRVYLELRPGAQRADAARDAIGYAGEQVDGTRRLWQDRADVPDDVRALAGPLWVGPLHDAPLLDALTRALPEHQTLENAPLERFLETARAEVEAPPLHYGLGELAHAARRDAPTRATLIERLRAAGYHADRTHIDPAALRTDAPFAEILAAFS